MGVKIASKNFKENLSENKKERKILLTIDDGLLSFYQNAWPILKEKKIPFILFINTREVSSFNYMNWNRKKPKKIILSPQFLKQNTNSAWYIFGDDINAEYKKDMPRAFALNSIENLKVNFDQEYVEPKVNYQDYFEDVFSIGVSWKHEAEKIVLGVDKEYVSFLDKNYLHPSYKPNPKGNPLVYDKSGKEYSRREMKLVVNQELINEILRLGDKVFVSEPLHLAEKIESYSECIFKKYKMI